MKRAIVSFSLCIVMILSMFGLTSCGAKNVEDINGKTPAEAFDVAFGKLENNSRYDVHIGMDISVKILFFEMYGISTDHFVTYQYDGANEACILVQEAVEQFEKEDMADVFYGYDDSIIYVDGVCYIKNGSNKEKFNTDTNPMEPSGYEVAVAEILEENIGKVSCYREGDLYYFTVEITDASKLKFDMGDSELYTVYFDDKSRIKKITVESKFVEDGIFETKTIMMSEYFYDDLAPIKAPDDANDYVLTDDYWWY